MPGGYFHYSSDSSIASSNALSSPPTSLLNQDRDRPSLEISPASSRLPHDPFVDPRLSLDSWSSRDSSGIGNEQMGSGSGSINTRMNREQSRNPSGKGRGENGVGDDDLSDRLSLAFEDGLPTPKIGSDSREAYFRKNENSAETDRTSLNSQDRSSSTKSNGGGGGGFLSQFRSGSGWFGPVVPPEPKLTRAEREKLEKERIDQMRSGGSNANRKRPGFMKRMSSGVEMMSSGFTSGSNGGERSPNKGNRSRSGTASTITEGRR